MLSFLVDIHIYIIQVARNTTNYEFSHHVHVVCLYLMQGCTQSGGYIKGFLNLRNLLSMIRIPCRHFVLCKVASNTNEFHS